MTNNTTGTFQFYQMKGFNYGWICPKCGKVYSPTTGECYTCNRVETEVTSTTIAYNDYENFKKKVEGKFDGNK